MNTDSNQSRLLFCIILFITLHPLSAQTITDSYIKSLNLSLFSATHNLPQEKLYLHVDRSSYWADEDIWFKAYLMNSPQKRNNVTVELLNSLGSVIHKKLYLAMDGLAYGDFHIADTTSSGMYQIRAYTNWMRNFDDNWFSFIWDDIFLCL